MLKKDARGLKLRCDMYCREYIIERARSSESTRGRIDAAHSIQGVSGAIAFGPDNKAVIVLSTDTENNIKFDEMKGDFFA